MKKKRMIDKNRKRGQVTIFIIIAIVIIAIVLVVVLYPRIGPIITGEINPETYLQTCIEERLRESVDIVMMQGGSMTPENYILYDGNKVEYLCYTNEDYQTCIMQQPLLLQHVEDEIKSEVDSKLKQCATSLEQELKAKGYSVSAQTPEFTLDIVPDKMVVIIDYQLTASKDGTLAYNQFVFSYESELYDLIMIAASILNFEAHYGDAETTTYMAAYPDISVEKYKQSDSSTVYIISHRETEEEFYFASRSLIWPAGYGEV